MDNSDPEYLLMNYPAASYGEFNSITHENLCNLRNLRIKVPDHHSLISLLCALVAELLRNRKKSSNFPQPSCPLNLWG
jgi:hypothetical protein